MRGQGLAIFSSWRAHSRFRSRPCRVGAPEGRSRRARRARQHRDRGPFENIDDLLRRTRVLLVPSLWAEARSRIVVEALAARVARVGGELGRHPKRCAASPNAAAGESDLAGYRLRSTKTSVPVA